MYKAVGPPDKPVLITGLFYIVFSLTFPLAYTTTEYYPQFDILYPTYFPLSRKEPSPFTQKIRLCIIIA